MISLTYVSSATDLLDTTGLVDLLVDVRPRNEERGVTGMLLYSGGNIIQNLEGPDDVVDATFASIERDPRHRGVLVVLREEVEERGFPDWSMGFRELGGADLQGVSGFTDFLRRPVGSGLGDSSRAAYRLLELFRENMR
ncbi:BLUF domain-containing protein [Nocardioides aquiterrae]|uniref:BLUF domain-containing protein n=1 Tax=Nocardioides aquiterrae TaxID=203799 RepID=A0ABP4F6F2_9ACTN